MTPEQKEHIARETRKHHGIEMHGDIPAKKHKMAKKINSPHLHENTFKGKSVEDRIKFMRGK